jgi:serine phosphatase RsbU (regulator of sigma subunit)
MVRYESQRTIFESGDRIVVWTDGIVEARDTRGEPFGDERLRAIVKDGGSAASVIEAVHRWRSRAESDDADDLTIVIADVTRE